MDSSSEKTYSVIVQDTLSSIDDLPSESEDVPQLPEDVDMASSSTVSLEEPTVEQVPDIIVTAATEESDMDTSDSNNQKQDNLKTNSGRKSPQRRKSVEMTESASVQVVYLSDSSSDIHVDSASEPPKKKLVKVKPATNNPDSSSDDKKEEGKIHPHNFLQPPLKRGKSYKNVPLDAQPSTSTANKEKQLSSEKEDDSSKSYESVSTTRSSKSPTKSSFSISNEETKTFDSEIYDDIMIEVPTEDLPLDQIDAVALRDDLEENHIKNSHDQSDISSQ